MKETQNTLPNWFEGTVYDEGDVITNPFKSVPFIKSCNLNGNFPL